MAEFICKSTPPQSDTNELIYTEQVCGYQGWGVEEGWMGVWHQHLQTLIHRMDKQ